MATSWDGCREPTALRRFGRNPEGQAVLLLLGATAAWGATFVVVKDAVTHMSVAGFLAWRFIVAAGLLAILRPRSLVRLGPRGWVRGVILGWALTGGYLLQTLGLRYTTAAVSGFLTGLSVVITPLLAWWFLRQRPRPRVWVATVMALCGLGVMSLSAFSFGLGEFLTIASAVSFSLQIVGLARWASSRDAYALAAVQLLTVATCCSLVSVPSGPHLPASGGAWAAVAVTAVMATCFAFIVQSWAQTLLSPSR
ncbi:MAG TPA: DMT family transporter, partial [Acidimicrobiales bacterium]|nr:DMT family transporter [Acidimicrobiales bacterium]